MSFLKIPSKKMFHPKFKKIALLTSGGDAPGMNACIRAVVRTACHYGTQVYGILHGYQGLLEKTWKPLGKRSVANILQRGGTILKTTRYASFHQKKVRKKAAQLLQKEGIEGLMVIGGEGSFQGACLFSKENHFPTFGIPATIDNDLPETTYTLGFDTALNTALYAIDHIRDTANAHERIFLIEVMGRTEGAIAAYVGLSGGAETTLLPQKHLPLPRIIRAIERGKRKGKLSSIFVIAEANQHGRSHTLSKTLLKKGYRVKTCILGHIQRGGPPTARDRFWAAQFGTFATLNLLEGKTGFFTGVSQGELMLFPLTLAFKKKKASFSSILKLTDLLAQ